MQDAGSRQFRLVETRWGWFGFVVWDDALCGTFLPMGHPNALRTLIGERFPDAQENRSLWSDFARRVSDYFRGTRVRFHDPVRLRDCPPFHRRVYEECRRIPPGKTASYQDLARAAGSEHAVRAVGNAMAHNRIPLVVPCHRVLRADGSIGGFSSPEGILQKQRMLGLEGIEFPVRGLIAGRHDRVAV